MGNSQGHVTVAPFSDKPFPTRSLPQHPPHLQPTSALHTPLPDSKSSSASPGEGLESEHLSVDSKSPSLVCHHKGPSVSCLLLQPDLSAQGLSLAPWAPPQVRLLALFPPLQSLSPEVHLQFQEASLPTQGHTPFSSLGSPIPLGVQSARLPLGGIFHLAQHIFGLLSGGGC